MRVLVCGGRFYSDKERVYRVLTKLHNKFGITGIIQGGATGADALAKQWAIENNIADIDTYDAQWKKYGNSAGPRRNRKMANESNPSIVVAFPGDRGTRDMISVAREHNIKTIILKRKDDGQ